MDIFKIEIPFVERDTHSSIGELILLFGAVEWLIANILLLSEIKLFDYNNVKNLSITQKYFESLLRMNFSQKLDLLQKNNFDISKLKEIGEYRNILSHGLIFKKENTLTIKRLSNPKAEEKELSKEKISKDIQILQKEGGRLLEFIKSKGYSYHIKNIPDTSIF